MSADVSAVIKDCEVFDQDRCSNPAPRAFLGHLPADRFFAALYIEIVGGQGSLARCVSEVYINHDRWFNLMGRSNADSRSVSRDSRTSDSLRVDRAIRSSVADTLRSRSSVRSRDLHRAVLVARKRENANDTVSSSSKR